MNRQSTLTTFDVLPLQGIQFSESSVFDPHSQVQVVVSHKFNFRVKHAASTVHVEFAVFAPHLC